MIITTDQAAPADFEIKKNGETETLVRGNVVQFCPYQPALILPGQLQGQLQIQRTPCGNWCPLFINHAGKPVLNCKK